MEMETTGTIRAYFLFIGSMDILMSYGSIQGGQGISWLALVGLSRGISYIGSGLALPLLLNRSVWLVSATLLAGLYYSFLNAFTRIFTPGVHDYFGVLLRLAVSVSLTLYVLDNVSRLATENQNGDGETVRWLAS